MQEFFSIAPLIYYQIKKQAMHFFYIPSHKLNPPNTSHEQDSMPTHVALTDIAVRNGSSHCVSLDISMFRSHNWLLPNVILVQIQMSSYSKAKLILPPNLDLTRSDKK